MPRRLFLALTLALFAQHAPRALASDLADKWEGRVVFNKVNLRFESDAKRLKSASTNFYSYPELFPVGTRFKVTSVSKKGIELETDKHAPLELEYVEKHTLLPFDDYLERTFSKDKAAIPAGFTASEKKLIMAGTVEPGMSRKAVFLALGYPPASITPDFAAKELAYQRTRFSKFKLHFGDDDRLASVEGAMTEAPAIPPPPEGDDWTGKTVHNRVNLRARFDNPDYESPSTNYTAYAKLYPVDTVFTVLEVGKKTVKLREAGTKTTLVLVYVPDHTQMPLEELLTRTFSPAAVPLPADLSKREQEMIHAGLVEAGMSRAAVFLAIGYPPGNLNPSFAADELVYMKLPAQKTFIHFDKSGKVSRIDG